MAPSGFPNWLLWLIEIGAALAALAAIFTYTRRAVRGVTSAVRGINFVADEIRMLRGPVAEMALQFKNDEGSSLKDVVDSIKRESITAREGAVAARAEAAEAKLLAGELRLGFDKLTTVIAHLAATADANARLLYEMKGIAAGSSVRLNDDRTATLQRENIEALDQNTTATDALTDALPPVIAL